VTENDTPEQSFDPTDPAVQADLWPHPEQCVVCGQPTGTAINVSGDSDWHLAALTSLGVGDVAAEQIVAIASWCEVNSRTVDSERSGSPMHAGDSAVALLNRYRLHTG
jgi:hypothetical protein